ncbi:Uncharacterized protein QTN25_007270 [Entamoeba marina]
MTDFNTLNTLLFDESTCLLLTICNQLINSSTKSFCIKNAHSLLKYFMVNNRTSQLFEWAINQEYPFDDELNHIISKDMVNSKVDFIDDIDPNYLKTVLTLTQLIEDCYNNINSYELQSPIEFNHIIRTILLTLKTKFKGEKLVVRNVFQYLLNRMFSNYFQHQTHLKRTHDPLLVDKYFDVFLILGDIFQKIAIQSNQPSLKNITTSMGSQDFVSPFIKKFINLNVLNNKYSNDELISIQTEFISLLKCNSSTIIHYLSPRIASKFQTTLNLQPFTIDDKITYNEVIESVNSFCRRYNTYLYATTEETQKVLKQLTTIKKEYEKQVETLRQKHIINDQLLNIFNNCRIKQKRNVLSRELFIEFYKDDDFVVLDSLKEQPKKLVDLLLLEIFFSNPFRKGKSCRNKSQEESPRSSPRSSPRESPRESPKESPKESPRIFNKLDVDIHKSSTTPQPIWGVWY